MDKNFINNPKPYLRTIYNWINQNPTIFDLLHLKKKKKSSYKKTIIDKDMERKNVSLRNKIFNMDYNDYNHEIGYFEKDLVEGANHKPHVLTIVDRNSSFFFSYKVDSKSASEVNKKIREIFDEALSLGLHIKSFSTDNGSEFMYSKTIEKLIVLNGFIGIPIILLSVL